MKKFLAALIAVFVITFSFTITEAAVDIPNFAKFTNHKIRLSFVEDYPTDCCYNYECSVDLKENFAEDYVSLLIKNYNSRLVGHFFNDYRKYSAATMEWWVLKYTGNKNVKTFVTKNYDDWTAYDGHILVVRHKNWLRGITYLSVKFSSGLIYGDD